MIKTSLLLFLLLISLIGTSQISGVILDKNTNEGISNVNIIKKNTKLGVSTNQKGFFSFNYFKIGDTLVVSHLSYTTEIVIAKQKHLTIKMQASSKMLSGAMVYSKKKEHRIIENPWVIDYELVDDSTLVIAKIADNGSRLDIIQNNISKSFQFSNIDRIEKDCIGNIYILRRDTAYRVKIEKGELYFTSFLDVSELQTIQKYCTQKINNNQYFNFFSYYNKLNVFNIFNDSVPLPFYKIFDKASFNFIFGNPKNGCYARAIQDAGGHRMGDNSPDKCTLYNPATFRDIEDTQDFINILTELKTISKLLIFKNRLILLDNVNSEIIYFDKSHEVEEINAFHLNFKNTDIKHIIQDPKTEETYYFVRENDKTNIYQFDFLNLEFKLILSRNRHIEEPKINNGVLYYLEYNIYDETRELYKIAL